MLLDKINRINVKMLMSVGHQLLTAVYGFSVLIILYRYAAKAEIGRWLIISSAVSLLDMLMHGFLQTVVIRKLSMENPAVKWVNTIASNALFFSLSLWLIASILILSASLIFSGNVLLSDLRWYLVLGVAMAFYNVSWWVGNARTQFGSVLAQRLIFSLISMNCILFFVLHKGSISIENLMMAQIAGYATGSVITLLFINNIKISYKLVDRGYLKYFFGYGKFTSGSMLMGSLLRNADVFMIAAFMNENAVAVYGTAQKTVEIFEVALRGMASHALPDFCKNATQFKSLIKKYIHTVTTLLLFSLPVAVLMFVFSDQVIHLLSGSNAYEGSSVILKIFMGYVLFLIVDRMTGVMLEAMGLARYNLVKTILLVVVNVAGNFIALYFFKSLPGVAMVSILAAITGIISGAYFIIRNSGLLLTRQQIRNGFNLVLK